MLPPFGCRQVKVIHGKSEAKRLVGRNPSIARSYASSSRQAEKEDDKASTVGMSSLDFNDLENGTDMLAGTTEPPNEGISTLEPPSALMEMNRKLLESNFSSNSENNQKRLFRKSPQRRRIECTARVPFLGTLPEEESLSQRSREEDGM